MGGEGLPDWLASRAASARVSCPLQGGKGGKPSIKTTSSSRSKPLKGKRVGAGSGSIADELLSRLGETIQVGHALALLSTQSCRWLSPIGGACGQTWRCCVWVMGAAARGGAPGCPLPTLWLLPSRPLPTPCAAQGMREDFIVVHLQEPCSFCREYMSEGLR